MDPLEPTTSTYRPRQSSYLRISPSSVLQMILYLEPSHTHWMNDGVLERMLFALKDRIPLKLQQEGDGKKHGKEKTHVDVFRGADYQMAFFFRRSNDKHVVLLKDKHLIQSTPAVRPPHRHPAPPLPSSSRSRSKRPRAARSPSSSATPAPQPLQDVDLRHHSDGEDEDGEPASKRRASGGGGMGEGNRAGAGAQDDDVVFIKPEPVDEDLSMVGASGDGGGLFRPEEEDALPKAEDGEEQYFEEDVKPTLKVTYQGYRIFGRTLVVIVEPYPPLAAEDLNRPRLLQTEIRQLSASVAPDAYTRRSVSALGGNGRSSLSATPVPSSSKKNPLFRSRSETQTPGLDGGEGDDDEDDEQMRRMRESTELLANEWNLADEEAEGSGSGSGSGKDGEAEEDEDDLPSLDAVFAGGEKGKGKGKAREVSDDDDDDY